MPGRPALGLGCSGPNEAVGVQNSSNTNRLGCTFSYCVVKRLAVRSPVVASREQRTTPVARALIGDWAPKKRLLIQSLPASLPENPWPTGSHSICLVQLLVKWGFKPPLSTRLPSPPHFPSCNLTIPLRRLRIPSLWSSTTSCITRSFAFVTIFW